MKNKLLTIASDIHTELLSHELSGNIGLHGGTSGIALFLSYYDKYILNSKTLNSKVLDILQYNIEWINSGKKIHTISRGFSGFGWLCEHLRILNMLSNEDIKFLDDLDYVLCKQMLYDVRHNNYEFLHGAIGVGLYFLSRVDKSETATIALQELISELDKSSITCENEGLKWLSVLNYDTGEIGYNISISHGMTGLISFLMKLYQVNIGSEKVERMLSSSINYVLKQITYRKGANSYFPMFSKEYDSSYLYSRLAWCYGDLSIAYILWHAAVLLNDNALRSKAIDILYFNANRLDLENNGVVDACLCHGTAGLAHIFRNLYLETCIDKFKDTANYWIDQTILMSKYSDGLAGFKFYRSNGTYVNSVEVLEGISGIGLVLLSQIIEEKLNWDEGIMLL